MNNRATSKRDKPAVRKVKPIAQKLVDVQGKPYSCEFASKRIHFKVDICIYLEHAIFIGGWASAEIPLTLLIDGEEVKIRKMQFERHDVNEYLNLPALKQSGFVLIFEDDLLTSKPKQLVLSWPSDRLSEQKSIPLIVSETGKVTEYDHHILGPAFWLYINKIPFNSSEWRKLIPVASEYLTDCPFARGVLESLVVCDSINESVLVGWVVWRPGVRVWLEDHLGNIHTLDNSFWQYRHDVEDVFGNEFSQISQPAGFVIRISGLKQNSSLSLLALHEGGIFVLNKIVSSVLSENPIAAANWLFKIESPKTTILDRFELVDRPILDKLINKKLISISELSIIQRSFGKPPEAPVVSLIIPLFGRSDFVEHQLIEFSRDSWIEEFAEIIYVIDDRKIYEDIINQASILYRLFKVSFKILWGGENRGFSGANNLGAQFAVGNYLLFLNSDVFPEGPQWLEPLIEILEENPDIGAVGPRLVFADGSIQCAGMSFIYRDDIGVWINHHPHIGLDTNLDPSKDLLIMQAITGACLLISRNNFDRIEGWDCSYLIGDFEDSDLCIKLSQIGLKVAYNPHVQLTHLERQSFKLLGQDNFRSKVMLYNASLHQARWKSEIENIAWSGL